MKLFFLFLITVFLFSHPEKSEGQETARLLTPGEMLLQLEKLKCTGNVLYIAAHPDDENTRLLTWFANEKKFRTAYLSLTRGDGGQNLIGDEQGDLLGLIRTYELMAARSIDGAEQFFTNARDFGFSKSPDETLAIWDSIRVLEEMVWIIRNFKPDIIITRFPETGEGGHGHHTASAILARQAFEAAADPNRFPEQLRFVTVWQTGSLWWNTFRFGSTNTITEKQYRLNAGVFIPLIGKWTGELASSSRSQHKSQGFGVERIRGEQLEYFKPLAGDTACGHLFCSIDSTLYKSQKFRKFSALIDSAISQFSIRNPSSILPLLFEAASGIPENDSRWIDRRHSIERIIQSAAGLWVEANSVHPFAVPGDSVKLKVTAVCQHSGLFKLNRISIGSLYDSIPHAALQANKPVVFSCNFILPDTSSITNPYWLNLTGTNGMFEVYDRSPTGIPVDSPALTVRFEFLYGTKIYSFIRPVIHKWTDPVKGELSKEFEIKPALTIRPEEPLILFTGQLKKNLRVTLRANRDSVSGTILFPELKHYSVTPEKVDFSLFKKNSVQQIEWVIHKKTDGYAKEELSFLIQYSGSDKAETGFVNTEIGYDHIPPLSVLQPASIKLISFDLKTLPGKTGYIPGSGDATVSVLRQAGFDITRLDEVVSEKELMKYKAIITGIRAYNTNEKMNQWHPVLMNYVKAGGTLIVQYNTLNFISTLKSEPGPYPFRISRERVTDEQAPVEFLIPEHPLLNYPNRITQTDFEGWIQERGLYFATDFRENYQPLLRMNDKNETNGNGSLIFTRYGKGMYIYTGLSFFRQLPAGVPGAFRLMANLIEAAHRR